MVFLTQVSLLKNYKTSTLFIALLFGLILLGLYLPLIVLNQTYLINNPIPAEYLTFQEKSTLFGITTDYGLMGNFPNIKLASDMVTDGNLPLWNPYVGLGYPLAADTTHHIFSPLNVGFLLPVEYWDLPLLFVAWVAGFSTFLFLRNLGLNFTSSIAGGILFMLSGTFTWFVTNPNPFVAMVTPLILYSLDKTFKNRNPKYIILLCFSFGFSILGAHLQSLFIQFFLILFYLLYRNTVFLIFQKNTLKNPFKEIFTIAGKSSLRVFAGLLGGVSLVSFYVFFVLDFFKNGILDNAIQYAFVEFKTFALARLVIPYILGDVTRTWTTNTEWASGFGYVGSIALFFAVFSLYYVKNKTFPERLTPIFFLLMSLLGLMRLANIPIISSVHSLPIFDIVHFGTYSGLLIVFGFIVSAAFGINYVCHEKISKKTVLIIGLTTLAIIGLLLSPVILEFSTTEHLSPFISESEIQTYIIFQVFQSIFFISISAMICFLMIKKRHLFIIIPVFVLLELSIYLTFGLHPISMAYKFILISFSMVLLLLFVKFVDLKHSKNTKIFFIFISIIITCVLIGHLIISEQSDYGMPTKYDSFGEHEVINFLKDNLTFQRMFSFEYTMRSDYSSGFKISSLASIASFQVNDFYTFSKNFLDEDTRPVGLGSTPWAAEYGPENAINKFIEHKKYFDFFGIKYIITQGYDLNSISYGLSNQAGNHVVLDSPERKVSQIFTSPVNSIDSIGITLFGMNFTDDDQLLLTLDSIPYSSENHRTSTLSKIKNSANNEFKIYPPITDVLDHNLEFSLHYPNSSDEKYVVLYFDQDLSQPKFSHIQFSISDDIQNDKFIPFIVTPTDKYFSIPFNFEDIFINENPDAFPRAFLVHDYVQVPPDTAQNYLLNDKNFDLRHSVILESTGPELNILNLNDDTSLDTVKILEFNENTILIETFSKSDSILILTDIYYPGWSVTIDDTSAEILRANGVVRSVIVPEGNHIVKFSYVPDSFWYGLLLSIITIMVLFGVYIFSKNKYYDKI